jgi:hypothetical protein
LSLQQFLLDPMSIRDKGLAFGFWLLAFGFWLLDSWILTLPFAFAIGFRLLPLPLANGQ